MLRTSAAKRALLEQAGYVFDPIIGVWKRRGEHPSSLQGRILDADTAHGWTREQIIAWIEAGEAEAN